MPYEDLLEAVGMDRAGVKVLPKFSSPDMLLAELESRHCLQEAVLCLAHFLPPRESVWWACQMLKKSSQKALDSESEAAALAAEQWALKPTEANRERAAHAAERAGIDTAEGMAAMAARFSTGSMAPGAEVNLPPPEKLYAKMSGGAVLLAMLRLAPGGDEFLMDALETGRTVLESAQTDKPRK